jgi:hypothetical protein
VALDDPVHFLDVTALEQPGERLQDAARSIVKGILSEDLHPMSPRMNLCAWLKRQMVGTCA